MNNVIEKTQEIDTDKIKPMIFDYIAYEVLTNETNKPYTAFIISGITNMDYDYVLNNMEVISNRHSISNKNNKRAISDIIIKIENTIVDIEINNDYYKGVIEKSNYYYSKIIANSLKKNVKYKDMPRVIQININNFAVNNHEKKINEYLSIEKDTHDVELSEFVKFHVNVDKIKKEWYNNYKLTDLEEALVLFLIDSKKDLEKITKNKPKLERAREIIMELNRYDYLLEGMEYDWVERYKQVCECVIEDRVEEAVEKATAKAKKEAENSIFKIINNLLKQNLDIEQIHKATGVSKEKIKELKYSIF